MFNVKYVWLILIAWILGLLGLNVGCALSRASDVTRVAEAAFAGESKVTYTVLPGDVAGLPNNTIAIPTVPGKNVAFTSYYPTGQVQWEFESVRDTVADTIIAALGGLDAQKFAYDAETRRMTNDLILKLIDELMPLVMQKLNPPAAPAQPSQNWQSQLESFFNSPAGQAILSRVQPMTPAGP